MVEVESEVQEDLNESAIKERDALVRQKQYEFEKKQNLENKEQIQKGAKKSFKKYISWGIILLVLAVLVVLVFAFNLI